MREAIRRYFLGPGTDIPWTQDFGLALTFGAISGWLVYKGSWWALLTLVLFIVGLTRTIRGLRYEGQD
jgi:hypothetical protein